nr:PAS domain S-box protein [Ottowia sp. GY511]
MLWGLLSLLVLAVLATLVWLARGYEIEQVQRAIERDTAEAAQVLRSGLARNLQDLHGLGAIHGTHDQWTPAALKLLEDHREWLRLEWRSTPTSVLASVDSPYYPPLSEVDDRLRSAPDAGAAQACASARKFGGPAYAPSHFVTRANGVGEEVMEVCLPLMQGQRSLGYLVATYSLGGVLSQLLGPPFTQRQTVVFTELDGTRLAVAGATRRSARLFVAQQIVDLPGTTVVLRLEGGRPAPDVFPNVLTALVTLLSIALVSVLVLLVRDFRRRQLAEAGLAQALAFRKAMEDSLVTGLRARDLDGTITYVNPAFCDMVGYSAQELIGLPSPAPYWPPENAHEFRARQAVRRSGQLPPREGMESVFMRKDGTRFPVLIIEAPLIAAHGRQTGWMGAVLDLTAQRRAEELSRASQERLQASARLATVGEMASLMSHELNQPLAAISSYATGSLNLLQSAADTPASDDTMDDVRVALARIAEQAGRAGKVINSVHDLVRRRATTRQAVAPRALFDAIFPLVQLQARKLRVTVELTVAPDLPEVWCEPTMIEQALINLARNAMQAMADVRGLRVLSLAAQPTAPVPGQTRGAVEFSVADTGEGISEEVAQQLFTPFFTTKAEGMGLGLSLCRTVVEQHGGTLSYTALQPQGTEFRFSLAVARAAGSQTGLLQK